MHDGGMALRIELFPSDLDRFVAFYVDVLGFEIAEDLRGDSAPYVAVRSGGARIGAAPAWERVDSGQRELPTGTEIVLEVDDPAELEGRVRAAGYPLTEGLTRTPWGVTHFRVHDPDGYHLRITSRAP